MSRLEKKPSGDPAPEKFDGKTNYFHFVRQKNEKMKTGASKGVHPSFFVPSFAELCAKTIAQNFEKRPTYGPLPPQLIERVNEHMSVDLPLHISVPLITTESYWKRCSMSNLDRGQVDTNTLPWKELYLQKKVQDMISRSHAPEDLKKLLQISNPFIKCLILRRMHSEVESFPALLSTLNCLTDFEVSYGVLSKTPPFKTDDDTVTGGPKMMGFTQNACLSLSDSLKLTKSVTHLRLPENSIDGIKLRGILPGLLKNSSVTHLDLSHNRIDDDGARALSSYLRVNTTLEELNLCDNLIHAEGGKAIARALLENRTLRKLNLRLNRIGEEGGKAICEALKTNGVLCELVLSNNELGIETAKQISDVMKENPTLVKIDLSGNPLTEEGGKCLAEAVSIATHVVELDARMCNIHENELREIHAITNARSLEIHHQTL